MKKQKGFTLIELVMVIVILGILSAVALPRFVNLSTEAQTATTQGVAGSLGSAFATNYAACAASSTACVAVDDCNDGGSLLAGGLPTGYTIAAAAIASGASVSCTVNGPNSSSATFTGIRN